MKCLTLFVRPGWDRSVGTASKIVAVLMFFFVGGINLVAQDESSATVFVNATVLPVDEEFSQHEALAIRGNQILAVGDRESVLKQAGDNPVIIDARGKTILPAFIDAHTHPVAGGGAATLFEPVGQHKFKSVEQALDHMVQIGRSSGEDDWLLFRDVDLATQTFEEDTVTTKHLDRVSQKTPVMLWHAGGHVATANSRMLQIMGVSAETPDPPGSSYGRFDDGSPNGMLYGGGAIFSALQKTKPYADYKQVPGTIELSKKWVAQGVGTFGVAGIGNTLGVEEWGIFKELAKRDEFPIRTRIYLYASMLEKWDRAGIEPGDGDQAARVVGYKISVDGSNQAKTGFQRAPYPGTESRGLEYMTEDEVIQTVFNISRRGHQLAMHGNGDAAIDRIIRAVAAARADGLSVVRPRIEHCSIVQDDQLEKLVQHEISGSFLIAHVRDWGKAFRDDVFGLEKAEKLDRAGSFQRRGIPFSLHTDFSVSELSPLEMVEVAVTRKLFAEPDYVLGKQECSSVEVALRGVTSVAAWQLQSEKEIGSLEAGKLADLVILEDDPRKVAPEEIGEIKVLETWIGGKKVF